MRKPRRCVGRSRGAHLVKQRSRIKNQVQAILQRNLVPKPPVSDLFGIKGRVWLGRQPLPPDEELAVQALLRQLDFHAQELRIIDTALGRIGLSRREVKRLMTIPGVDATIALSIVAAVGDFHRFARPEQLVSYLGLTRGCASPAISPPAMGGSPNTAERTPAGCLSKRRGPRSALRAHHARSMSGSVPAAGCRSRSWQPRASSRCSAGTSSSRTRTMRSLARR